MAAQNQNLPLELTKSIGGADKGVSVFRVLRVYRGQTFRLWALASYSAVIAGLSACWTQAAQIASGRFFLMPSSRVIAFDFGASHLAGGVFEFGENGLWSLRRFAHTRLDLDAGGDVMANDSLVAFLREFTRREKKNATTVFALPGHLTLLKFGKVALRNDDVETTAITSEVAQLIPCSLSEVVWDHLVLANDGNEFEFLLAAAKLKAVQDLCTTAGTAGLSVQRIMPAALALRSAFRLAYPEVVSGAILADIGARTTNLVFIDGERFWVRSFPLGGNQITRDVATELNLEFAAADALKQSVLSEDGGANETSPAHAAVHVAARKFIRRLQTEIVRSTLNYRNKNDGSPPEILYLTGTGARIPELAATLAKQLQLRVERYDPMRNLRVDATLSAEVKPNLDSLANLIGLAALTSSTDGTELNLLPPRLPLLDETERCRRFVGVAVAGMLIAVLFWTGYFQRRLLRARDEAAQLHALTVPLQALKTDHVNQLEKIEGLRTQISALERMVALKSSWAVFLDDLQNRLETVGDVWLDQLAILPATASGAQSGREHPSTAKETAMSPPVRLALSGRLLDVAQPLSKVSPAAVTRAQRLVANFAQSEFVAAVEHERFDSAQPGLLRFDLVLVMNARRAL